MPWLTIIMAILSFLASMKETKGDVVKSAMVGGLVGAGTYAVTHETTWGRENLGQFDGVIPPIDPLKNPDGATSNMTIDPVTGKVVSKVGGELTGPNAPTTGWDVLQDWGPTGTASVIGTSAVAGGLLSGNNKILVYGAIALGAFLLLK